MKKLRLAFVDFEINWGPWPDPVRYFEEVLRDDYELEIVYSDFRGRYVDMGVKPDLAICAVPGEKHRDYICPKIFFPGEPREINFSSYDFAMTHNFSSDPRHYRLPLYALYADQKRAAYRYDGHSRYKFCCVLFGKSYPHNETPREWFFRELNKYKRVDSAGTHLNNTGFTIPPILKAEFIKDYKFVLSFESCALPGFTTEKCFEPLEVGSVPVYWGNSQVGLDFNPASIVNAGSTEDNLDWAIQKIIQLDRDDDAYRRMTEQHIYSSGYTENPYINRGNIVRFFRSIV